jgi:hypothetical protein
MESAQTPYSPPASKVETIQADQAPPYFKSWLIFFLVSAVGGGIGGAAAGSITGVIAQALGYNMTALQIASGIAGFVVSMPISYFTFKWSVSKYLVKP